MQTPGVDDVHTRIMRVETGVVVDIDAGKCAARAHAVYDLGHDLVLRRDGGFGARPDAIEVRLLHQMPQPSGCGGRVADKQTQRTGQRTLPAARLIAAQQRSNRFPTRRFVAMHQYRDEQRRFATTREVDQRRTAQHFVQLVGRQFEDPLRQGGQLTQQLISPTHVPVCLVAELHGRRGRDPRTGVHAWRPTRAAIQPRCDLSKFAPPRCPASD